jgi:hypothetical protein
MAPVNSTHFKEMKNEIDKLEEINKIKNENKIEKQKITYYQKT